MARKLTSQHGHVLVAVAAVAVYIAGCSIAGWRLGRDEGGSVAWYGVAVVGTALYLAIEGWGHRRDR